VKVSFADPALEELEQKTNSKTRLSHQVVRAYRKTMNFIRDATDERDLRFPGLHMEKLKGKRSHQYSIRLNNQWRIIFEINKAFPCNVIHIISIEDYH
jgi:toxin HigB-1